MRNAFASILQARPCPTFGRPVRLRDSSLDYGPAVLLMPFGFHLAVDTLPSGSLPASEALPPLLDMAPLIRAPEGLEPSQSVRCPAHTTGLSDCSAAYLLGLRP